MKQLDAENQELTFDQLPESENTREKTFIHASDLRHDTLNLCLEYFKKANLF